jgi:hypothetical protein
MPHRPSARSKLLCILSRTSFTRTICSSRPHHTVRRAGKHSRPPSSRPLSIDWHRRVQSKAPRGSFSWRGVRLQESFAQESVRYVPTTASIRLEDTDAESLCERRDHIMCSSLHILHRWRRVADSSGTNISYSATSGSKRRTARVRG